MLTALAQADPARTGDGARYRLDVCGPGRIIYRGSPGNPTRRADCEVFMRRLFSIVSLAAAVMSAITALVVWPTAARAGLLVGEGALTAYRPGGHGAVHSATDFFLPGTQPGMLTDSITDPTSCLICHANYNGDQGYPREQETWTAWQGSMMAQSGRDPLFWAALDVANADSADTVGEWCLRCHTPRGWLEGRSTPSDGSALNPIDLEGVQCELCHRMVDPFYSQENPSRDPAVLAGINPPLTVVGSGALIVDPQDERRAPLRLQEDWAFNPHGVLGLDWPWQSPYHKDAALCGSCHDISNPLFSWDDASQSYQPNDPDTPAPDLTQLFPIERTYSEWQHSAYPQGVYAPQFGGNQPVVATCQDCHMRAVTGVAGQYFGQMVVRQDMPWHDLTGANTWVPQMLPLHPTFGAVFQGQDGAARAQALTYGIERARYNLQHAASLAVDLTGQQLSVTITNETGHKLPTGYPEGRRMWLQVAAYNQAGELVYVSGAYDAPQGTILPDPALKVYEVKQGLTSDWAAQLGLPAGPSFHFALNNAIYEDNRIPPRGYNFDAFAAVGAAPVSDGQPDPARYADGQYWDLTSYILPQDAAYGVVRLLYQTASGEYVTFLRDNNPDAGSPGNNGQILYDLWEQTGRSQPEIMAEKYFGVKVFLPVSLRAR